MAMELFRRIAFVALAFQFFGSSSIVYGWTIPTTTRTTRTSKLSSSGRTSTSHENVLKRPRPFLVHRQSVLSYMSSGTAENASTDLAAATKEMVDTKYLSDSADDDDDEDEEIADGSCSLDQQLFYDMNDAEEQRYLRFAGVGKLYANKMAKEAAALSAAQTATTTTTTTTTTNQQEETDEVEEEDDNNEEDETAWRNIVDVLHGSHVIVIGLGGVGSWAAEALARSGIGQLTLIDLDDICISNTNRQLHALSSTVGQMKIDVMTERLQLINPDCNITRVYDFVLGDNVHEILRNQLTTTVTNDDGTTGTIALSKPTAVLDAIDGTIEKSALLAACMELQLPVVSCGGAAGIFDPTQLVVRDLTQVSGDPLLGSCRKRLRKHHGFPAGTPGPHSANDASSKVSWNIECVYSLGDQPQLSALKEASFRRCDGGLGTACHVTGTFGFIAASRIVEGLATNTLRPPTDWRTTASVE